jgi:glycosyltransferase involved in cell wall biosynthesis
MRRISVVIPSHQHARFVAEAIRSVAVQDVPELELIVVDDGSSDGSGDVIRRTLAEIGLARVQFIEQPNEGAHRAIARGIDAATGDVLAILNSDDRFHPQRFARMAREFPASGDFLAFSAVTMIDAAGDALGADSSPMRGYQHALYEATRCPSIGFALLRNNIAVTSGNFVFTRTLYEKIGGFQPFQLAHDWDFALQALVHVEPIFVPEPLLDYRTHGDNTRLGSDADSVNEEGRAILVRYLAQCREATPPNPLAPCERNWPVYFDLFVSRYHAWFGQGPLRDWMDEAPQAPKRESWRAWSDVVDFDRVDDCDYLVDPDLDPARRAALAVAREVLIERAHPLGVEEGDAGDALREAYARAVRRIPRVRRTPWVSPVARTLAKPSPRMEALGRLAPGRLVAGAVARAPLGALRETARQLYSRFVVQRSGIFDATYYREQCRARDLRVIDPVLHYLRIGAALGLDPHPMFQTRYYLLRNPDIAGKVNPLMHYLQNGDTEGRRPHPLFDPGWYRAANPDVVRQQLNTLSHFVRHGQQEGRSGHPRFDASHYLESSAATRGGNLWLDYVQSGRPSGVAWNRREALRLHLEAADAADGADALPRDRERETIALRRLRMSGLFDAEYYESSWGTGIDELGDAARHFLERGAIEGVAFCPVETIENRLEELESEFDDPNRPELAYLRAVSDPPHVAAGHRVTLYVSSHGNAFFMEMAEHLALGFRCAGAETRIVDETAAGLPPEGPREHAIVIAPHEFFLLGDGPQRLSRRFLARCSLWLAEQPGSEFFAMCLWFARFARRVLDVNPLTALAWGELGVPARALPLGWIEGLDDFADALEIEAPQVRAALEPEAREPVGVDRPLADRPLDVCFNGVLTQHREKFFARNAWFFAGLRCALFMPTPRIPISARVASSLSAHDATALSQRSKILLNIHRSEMPYFEWHRLVVRGIWQKTLVVSDPSRRVPGFEPGVHYIECTLEEMPRKIEWLLRTDAGRAEAEAIRTRAFDALQRRYPLAAMAAAFLAEDAASQERA